MFWPGSKRASFAGETSEGAGSGPVGTGLTVSVAVRVAPPPTPVIVTAVVLATVLVETVKVALVAPAATVTLAGSVGTAVVGLDSVTTRPPAGAALVSVAVPVEALPPVTEVGLRRTERGLAGGGTGVAESVAVRVLAPCVAVIVTAVEVATVLVETVKVAVEAPEATVTLAGTVATVVFELERLTSSPPLGAALISVTVPVAPLPPTTLVGLTLTADRLAVGGGACAVKRRELEKGPLTPAEFLPRTRQKSCWAGRPVTVVVEGVTTWLKVSGVVKLLELSIWISYVAA